MASMAESDASKPSKLTKPKPLLDPESGSRMILGVAMTMPKALNVSYNSCRTVISPQEDTRYEDIMDVKAR